VILNNQLIYAKQVLVAKNLFARMKGLLGRKSLGPDTAMIIDPCSSIHTLGMRFAIDVIFLDSKNTITAIAPQVQPGRFWVSGGWRARRVVESEAGLLPLSSLHVGDSLTVDE
jgi:uncharacterized membrane protein (UPF0127 family)